MFFLQNFMMSYGYLEPKDPRLGEFRTKDDLITGIKKLQGFGGLKVTGIINEETVKLIKTPRCSMPDFGPSDKMKRRKRYALHDSVWKKHVSSSLRFFIVSSSFTKSKKNLQWFAKIRYIFNQHFSPSLTGLDVPNFKRLNVRIDQRSSQDIDTRCFRQMERCLTSYVQRDLFRSC